MRNFVKCAKFADTPRDERDIFVPEIFVNNANVSSETKQLQTGRIKTLRKWSWIYEIELVVILVRWKMLHLN